MRRETLIRIWNALFPEPRWVRDFEAALEADRTARQRLYAYWDNTLQGVK
jgi:hypothetical protein